MVGDGDTPMALTDMRDVGRFVARAIADPRTLNKSVFAWGEEWTQARVWELLERVSGEEIPRKYVSGRMFHVRHGHADIGAQTSGEEIQAAIDDAKDKMSKGATDFPTQLQLFGGQYQYSWGIRGDNTLEHARYLGYLDARELYPDLKPREFKDYVRAVVDGTAPKVWETSQDWGN